MSNIHALTLKQLRALQSVAKTGSLTVSARELNLTVPTIHSQINNLESAVGCALFHRPTGGAAFRLTTEGVHLLRAADRMHADLSQALATIEEVHRGRTGRVRLAVVSTGKYFAPRLVRTLTQIRPEIDIALKVGNRSTIIAEMDRARYDLVIMGRPPRSQMANAAPIGPNPHGIVLPPDHPMAREEGFDPERLLQETFLLREEGSGTRILAKRFLERFGLGEPARWIEMDSNETIKQAIMAGLGIAMLSLHTVHDELQQGRLALLRGPSLPVMRHWYLIRPDGGQTSPAAAQIADEIIAMHGSFLP